MEMFSRTISCYGPKKILWIQSVLGLLGLLGEGDPGFLNKIVDFVGFSFKMMPQPSSAITVTSKYLKSIFFLLKQALSALLKNKSISVETYLQKSYDFSTGFPSWSAAQKLIGFL